MGAPKMTPPHVWDISDIFPKVRMQNALWALVWIQILDHVESLSLEYDEHVFYRLKNLYMST